MIQPSRPRAHGAAAAVALTLMVVSLVACSDDPVAPTTTAPAGYMVMSDAEEGFALAVPSDWTRIPLSSNPDTFNKDANALRRANPKLASILNQARVLGQKGGVFMAVNPDGTASVNLTVDKPKEKSLEEVVRASVTGLTQFGAKDITQAPGTVDGKPATKVNFRLTVDTDAGAVETDETQHYLLANKKAYIISMLATPPDVASAIITSFKLR